MNNQIYPSVADVLTYIKGLKPQHLVGATFGSYGWSGESVKLMNSAMEEMKLNVIEDGQRVKYVPTHDNMKECVEMGKRIGKAVKESIEQEA